MNWMSVYELKKARRHKNKSFARLFHSLARSLRLGCFLPVASVACCIYFDFQLCSKSRSISIYFATNIQQWSKWQHMALYERVSECVRVWKKNCMARRQKQMKKNAIFWVCRVTLRTKPSRPRIESGIRQERERKKDNKNVLYRFGVIGDKWKSLLCCV